MVVEYTVPANVTIDQEVLELANLTFGQANQHIFVYPGGDTISAWVRGLICLMACTKTRMKKTSELKICGK